MLENHVFSNFSIYLFYTYSEYPMGIRYPTHTHTRILLSAITILLYMIVCNDSCIKLWPQRFFDRWRRGIPRTYVLSLFLHLVHMLFFFNIHFQHPFCSHMHFEHPFCSHMHFEHPFWEHPFFFQTSILNIHFFKHPFWTCKKHRVRKIIFPFSWGWR